MSKSLSERAKSLGFSSLARACSMIGENPQNMHEWNKTNPLRVDVLLRGAAAMLEGRYENK